MGLMDSNVDLVWTPKVRHGGTNKVSIEIAYIAHACVWILRKQTKWCGNPSGMEHAKKLALTKGYKDPINKKPPWPYLV
jgi:hypothetical protein